MGFFSPWFLAGMLAVGLPLWLHLLKRHRNEPMKFPSLMFFERSIQSSVKHRRLMYLMLLAFRLAILVLLALAFANPFIKRPPSVTSAGGYVRVIAIDRSFSMRAGDSLERAKREALGALSGLGGNDRAQVVSLASRTEILTPATRDRGELQSAIASIKPGDSRASYGELSQSLRQLTESARQNLEVHFFSDLQKSGLPPGFNDLKLPTGTKLVVHEIAPSSTANWAIDNVIAPRQVGDPKRLRVQATVAGYGTSAARKSISLWINGRQAAAKLADVPANGRATVEFLGADVPYGWTRAEIRVDGSDALDADNIWHFALERADARRLLFVREPRQTRPGFYFRNALEASGASNFSVEEVDPGQAASLELARFAFVVLNDPGSVPEKLEDNLKRWVSGGGRLLIAAGPATAAAGKVPLLEAVVDESRYAARSGERFLTVIRPDATHPVVRVSDRFEGVKFFQAIKVQPAKLRVVARLSDDTPLLVERPYGEGRVLFMASGLDNIANDFPIHPSFVPFVEQTALYLANAEERPTTVVVDSFVELRSGGSKDRAASVEVLDPKGDRALTLEESVKAQTIQVSREGFWELGRPNARRELISVNADRRESDLSTLPKETVEIWKNMGSPATNTGGGGEEGDGIERPWSFWWYLALLLLIAAAAESVFADRYLKVERSS